MTVQVASNLVPKGGAKWPVLEDVFFRGGYRVVANLAARDVMYTDSQQKGCLKVGMLVCCADTMIVWQYVAANTWKEFKPNPCYTHTQADASTSWAVAHNKGSRHCTFTIIDSSGFLITPDSIQFVDDNNLILSFLEAQDGEATFSFNLS